MSKNIILLSGSPRKDGNTDKLVAAFIEGAGEDGKKVALFKVAEMKIGGCLGCNHCFEEKGVCVQKDDMQQIVEALGTADALVIASPVYFWNVTAQVKAAIDRTYVLINKKTPIAKAALLMTSGDKDAKVADSSITMFDNMCKYSKWENAGAVIAGGLHDKNDIVGRPELEQAWKLGQTI